MTAFLHQRSVIMPVLVFAAHDERQASRKRCRGLSQISRVVERLSTSLGLARLQP